MDGARDLPGERLLLLLGAAFSDVTLDYGHDPPLHSSSLISVVRSLVQNRRRDRRRTNNSKTGQSKSFVSQLWLEGALTCTNLYPPSWDNFVNIAGLQA